MDEFVANFDLDRQEFEADFELEQPVEFDAVFEINPAGASWGGITGTLANQTDLKNELDTLSGQIDSNHQAITEINTTIQGYGDIVTYNASDFATSAQGLLADTALQPNDNISELVNDVGYITSASLPTVNDGILTIQKNGSNVAVFSANQSGNQTANIIVPTDTSDLTNNAGYTTNIGTVTSVNDVSPDSDGNVTLSIPAAQVNSDWNASSGVSAILNKPNLATVATTGSYTDLSNKPTINDLTTTAQQNALNSGATTTNIGQITTNTNDISDIQDLIPTQATSSNQLADKAFVNSSIATNTANFIGTFNSVAELEAYSGTLTNNDYAFVVGTDSEGNTVYDRYKYTDATNPPSWEFEYELNNSSFTAAQWDAINSGITSGDVTLIGTALQPNDNISELVNNAGYITGINSTDVTTALGYTPVNPSTLATVATSGSYDDLTNKPTIPTNYVTTDTAQDITGTKTFVGQKKVGFKQSSSSDKLGFTLYNNSGTEKGYLEYNPSNTVDSVPLMTLGNYASASGGLTHVGFRKYSSVSGANGAYNLLTPLISDAKTPFNLTTTYTNFYLPLGFTDGSTTIKTAKTGLVDLSGLDFVLSSSLASVATSGSYNDLTDKPTIPTVNNATLTITQGGVTKGTFTANAGSDVTIDLDAGGGGSTYTAGNFIDITSDVISVDLDGTGTLPTLSSDGTMGGDSYACSATSAYTGWNAYRAFDGDLETNWSPYGQTTASLYYYSPKAVKATNVKITFAEDEAFRGVKIQGSNDGSSYTQLATYDNSASDTIINIPVTTSIAYKYYQIYFDVVPSGPNWGAVLNIELSIDATILTDENISSTNITDALGYIPYNSSNPDGYLANKSTGTESLAIGNITNTQNQNTVIGIDATSTQAWNTVIGRHAQCTGSSCILLGDGLSVSGTVNVCIGDSASTSGNNTIQLGAGTNNTSNTFNVGFGSSVGNYTLLDGTTGLIPDARINKQTSISSSSTDAQIPSAKCVYDNVKNTVTQTTTDTITLYAWVNLNSNPDTLYTTTYSVGKAICFDSYGNYITSGTIVTVGQLSANGVLYYRTSSSDTETSIKTLTDYSGNDLNIKQADGQWVSSYIEITSANISTTLQTYSLSDYLPDDNYDYEVIFAAWVYKNGDSNWRIGTDLFPIGDGDFMAVNSGYGRQACVQIILPVGIGRTVSWKATSAGADCRLRAYGYRRIGTNL